ncbi:MAG: hypothetical protein R3266_12120, partial [Gemmatimonadota bacterium]|nr:hypothetical protein [Gemmatimonadota bacterium]
AVGDLRDRRFLTLHRVSPESGERLAGASLGYLGGFLEREWRAADFEAGRRDAARLLSRHFSDLLSYEEDPDAIRVPDPGDTSYRNASPASRALVERWMDREARRALDAVRPSLPIRLLGWLWKPALRRSARRRLQELLEGRAATRGG